MNFSFFISKKTISAKNHVFNGIYNCFRLKDSLKIGKQIKN